MPVVLPDSFTVGQTVRLWPKDSRSKWCHLVAPDGREMRLKAEANGSVEVWLAQPGDWSYEWTDKDQGTLKVEPAALTERPAPVPTRWEMHA